MLTTVTQTVKSKTQLSISALESTYKKSDINSVELKDTP